MVWSLIEIFHLCGGVQCAVREQSARLLCSSSRKPVRALGGRMLIFCVCCCYFCCCRDAIRKENPDTVSVFRSGTDPRGIGEGRRRRSTLIRGTGGLYGPWIPAPAFLAVCLNNMKWVYAMLQSSYCIKCALYSCGVRSRGRPELLCIYRVEPWWWEGTRGKRRYDGRMVFFRFYIIIVCIILYTTRFFLQCEKHTLHDRTRRIILYCCNIHTFVYHVLYYHRIAYTCKAYIALRALQITIYLLKWLTLWRKANLIRNLHPTNGRNS